MDVGTRGGLCRVALVHLQRGGSCFQSGSGHRDMGHNGEKAGRKCPALPGSSEGPGGSPARFCCDLILRLKASTEWVGL